MKKKVLILGGAGFIGLGIARYLGANRDYDITIADIFSPGQKDSDSLPSYGVLDPILEYYIEADMTPREISEKGFDIDTVERVTTMVDRNEYKRRQAAPGVRISRRAFGRDRRFPITSRYTEHEPL